LLLPVPRVQAQQEQALRALPPERQVQVPQVFRLRRRKPPEPAPLLRPVPKAKRLCFSFCFPPNLHSSTVTAELLTQLKYVLPR